MPRKHYRRKKKEGDWLGGVVVVLAMVIFTNMDRGASVQGLASSLLTSVIVSAVLVVIGSQYLGQARSEEPASIHSICLDLRCF